MASAASLRVPLYRRGRANGPLVGLVLGGVFVGIYLFGMLFHTTGEPVQWVALVAMVLGTSAAGGAVGWKIRARKLRPLAFLQASGESLELVDRGGRSLAASSLSALRVNEGWYFAGSRNPGSGGGNPAYTLLLDLGGLWSIASPGQVVVEKGFAVGAEARPNAHVTGLDYLRLRRLLMPERAAKLADHMQELEAFLLKRGIGDRHPAL